MVASPDIRPRDTETRLTDLEATVAAMGRQTSYSVRIGSGGITIDTGGGITLPPGGSIVDASGHTLLQADVLGGLSRPWQSVPLRPLFDDGTILGSTSNRTHSGFYGPIELLQGQIATDQLVWAGTIPELLNPKMSIYGWFGYTSNLNTITTTINFNGSTVATISSNALILPQSAASVFGPFDIHTFLGQQAINVQIFAHSTQSQGSTDTLACDIQQMVLRGS